MERLVTYFRNLKFRKKLFLSYMITIIIPITILGMYSYYQSKNFLLQQARQGLNDSIRQIAENINYRFKRYNSTIDFIAYNKRIQQVITNNYQYYSIMYLDLLELVDPVFNSALNQNEDISQISIYTSNKVPEYGKAIMSVERIKNEEWFKKIEKGTNTGWYKMNGSLFGIRRIYTQYQDMDNFIYVKLNYDLVFDNFQSLKLDKAGIIISDGKDEIIYSKRNSNGWDSGVNEKEIMGMNGEIVKIGGVNCILIRNRIQDTNWTITYYTPVSSVAVNAENIVGATIVIVSLCILLLIFITWIFSNTFVKNIENLNKKIDMVEKGDLKVRVSSLYKDEIGELTNKFGRMLNNINTLIKEVYQSRITQKEAELRALQAQINPHFLYNTLSIINWKAIEIDADEISHITTSVSTFYRSILNKGRNVISIADELENMRIYIDIQLIMHNNSFDVVYKVDDEILKYKMINIILQPIVENAIGHGIDNKEDGNRGLLIIEGQLKEQGIEFTIEDNGPGMETEKITEVLIIGSAGYGLKNVHDRIRLFFGDSYGVEITSEKCKGTKIKVRIPKFEGTEEQP